MISAKINGETHKFEEGIPILKAARSIGIDVPTLCSDDRLKAAGACRLCIVDIRGEANAAASCMCSIRDGMEIETHSRGIEHARELNLRMLARNYPREAFEQYPDKNFHRLARKYGLGPDDFAKKGREGCPDNSHRYISVDMARCIDCYQCVRICDELQGQFVWKVADRGGKTRILPDSFGAFGESTCVSCGACSDACPTGALEDKSYLQFGAADKWTKTVCPYCGTGCEISAGTKNDRIVQVKPVLESPVSQGHLCVKGRYAFGFADAPDRITEPMIRLNGDWKIVSWEEAIAFAAGRLKKLVAENGAESIAVLGSARATNEENYVAQKFVRVALETNNVDCCARVCHTPTAAAMKMMLGTGAATNSFNDIEHAKTFLLCGANPTENHPIPGARIRQAVIKGAKLIVIDPRKTELTKYADVHLQLRAGTNILLFNALAHTIIEEGLCDQEFIAERVLEFEEFREFAKNYAPEDVAERCGVSAGDIRKAARLYAGEKPAMSFHGLGITEHIQGTEGVMCVVNLALLTGNIGKKGAGVNPLRGQNNVQGAAQMGCDPGVLTGGISLDEGRQHFESVWGVQIPRPKGLNQLQMMDAAYSGKLKALWSIGYDVYLSNANAHRTAESLENLEVVIIQDLFLNETAKRFGTIFFPACSSYEKEGTFMNAERRVSLLRKAIEPRGNSKTDWEIICLLAKAMGIEKHFDFNSSEDIWNEIRRVWKNAAGISYERLHNHGLQWNCPSESHPGTEILHTESFNYSKEAALRRVAFRPTKEVASEEFPLLLTTGRTLYHFNAGTMTGRTPNIDIRPSDLLSISPQDAKKAGIADGDRVWLRSAYGETMLPVEISKSVKQGELFTSFHSPEIFLNHITSHHRDRFVMAPEYKVTAVRIEKAPG